MRPGGGRDKGHAWERECCKLLEEALGIKFQRILSQTREGGLADIEPVEVSNFPFVIECKRYGVGVQAKPEWWDQVCVAARKAGGNKFPCLIYRYDRQQPRVRVPLEAVASIKDFNVYSGGGMPHDWKYACEMDMKTFFYVCRELL